MKYLRTRSQRHKLVYGSICYFVTFSLWFMFTYLASKDYGFAFYNGLIGTLGLTLVIVGFWLLDKAFDEISNWISRGDEK